MPSSDRAREIEFLARRLGGRTPSIRRARALPHRPSRGRVSSCMHGKAQHMYDYELLATDMIKLPTRALPRNWKAVTAADVVEMLRHAGVREPWRAPQLGCYSLAQCINNPLGYQSLSSAKSAVSKKPAEHDCGVNDREPSRTKAERTVSRVFSRDRTRPQPC